MPCCQSARPTTLRDDFDVHTHSLLFVVENAREGFNECARFPIRGDDDVCIPLKLSVRVIADYEKLRQRNMS
jgi:hypothetical protein